MASNSKHVHKLKRHKFGSGNTIYFCVLPDCSFKIKQALSLGKKSICWRCGNAFEMNEYSIRLAKPHCTDCHQSKAIVFENTSTIATSGQDVIADPYIGTMSVFDKLKKVTSGEHISTPNEIDEDEEL